MFELTVFCDSKQEAVDFLTNNGVVEHDVEENWNDLTLNGGRNS